MTNQSETNWKEEESSFTALSHIFCILKWSGIQWNASGMVRITSLHISCVQKWSGTNNSIHNLFLTASLHISSVLKRPGTYANESQFMRMALSHISCVLRWSGIVTIQLIMFIYALKIIQKIFVSGHQIQKDPCLIPCFSSSNIHQSQYLDGCKAMGKSSSFIKAFWALRFSYQLKYLSISSYWSPSSS